MGKSVQLPLLVSQEIRTPGTEAYIEYQNCTGEINYEVINLNQLKKDHKLSLKRRPGFKPIGDTTHANYGRGIYNWTNVSRAIAVVGNRIYRMDSSSTIAECSDAATRFVIGTTETDFACRAHFAEFIGNTGNVALLVQQTGSYTSTSAPVSELSGVNGSTFVVTRFNDPQLPTNCVPGVVNLDGYCFVMTIDKKIFNSDLNVASAWPGDFLTSTRGDGIGVGLARYLNYVVAFNERYIEFFYNAGNASGSPLATVEGAVYNIGCGGGNTIVNMVNTLVFVSKNMDGSLDVKRFSGLQLEKISTPSIEKEINAETVTTQREMYAHTLNVGGHNYYILHVDDQSPCLVFDFQSNMWSRWKNATHLGYPITATCDWGYSSAEALGLGDGAYITGVAGKIFGIDDTHGADVRVASTTRDLISMVYKNYGITFGTLKNKFIRRFIAELQLPFTGSSYSITCTLQTGNNVNDILVSNGSRVSAVPTITSFFPLWANLGRFQKFGFTLTINEGSLTDDTGLPGLRVHGLEVDVDLGSYGL